MTHLSRRPRPISEQPQLGLRTERRVKSQKIATIRLFYNYLTNKTHHLVKILSKIWILRS